MVMAAKIMPEFKKNTNPTASKLNLPKIFTQIYILLNLYITISNPNTYICDPDEIFPESINNHLSPSKTRYSNYNNGIPCSSLLPSYHHQHKHNLQNDEQKQSHLQNHTNIPIYFENECNINFINDNEYLFTLFHCDYNYDQQQQQVHHLKSNRYHKYYHYDLKKQRNTSYAAYFQHYIKHIETWWSQFSFNKFWNTIPSQWKVTTTFIGIVDALFVIIIKYLVFEDNYAV